MLFMRDWHMLLMRERYMLLMRDRHMLLMRKRHLLLMSSIVTSNEYTSSILLVYNKPVI